MTWPEIREAADANLPVVVPVGATEQHGPHLPVSTDCVLPAGVAVEVGKHLALIIAPPIHFGARSRALSGGGETFPGTLSLRVSTLIQMLYEVLCGLRRSGFRRICVQNWHFENTAALWEGCDLAVERHSDLRILLIENSLPEFTQEELSELYPGGFPGWDVEHAAIMETSMMLALRPDLVRLERVQDDEAVRHPSWDVVPAPAEFIPKSGVLWHASQATEESGRKFLKATAARLESALRTEFSL